jgi:hypothetical protein
MGAWDARTGWQDGRWPEAHAVEVRYPLTSWTPPEGISDDKTLELMKADRQTWPWLTGEIAGQCGPDEWEVVVYDDRLAQLEDGSPAPEGTPGEDLFFPRCFRDSSEIREPQRAAEVQPGEPGYAREYAATHRVLCAHADQDGRGAHWLEPGEKSPAAALARLDAEVTGPQLEAGS